MPRPKGLPKTGGRRKGTPNHALERELLWPLFGRAVKMLDAALQPGAKVSKTSQRSAEYVIDQCLGKAVQKVEATGPGGGPVEFRFVEHRGGAVS